MIILGKRHTGNDRMRIERGELHTIQDFAERLTLRFNNEIQTEHFGGSCTVSLEGVAVIKLLSKPCKTGADNPIKSRPTDPFIAQLCQLSHLLSQLRQD